MIWNKIESARREDIEVLQLKRLQETVARVYSLTPFYQDKFKELDLTPSDIKTLDDVKNYHLQLKKI